MWISPFAKATSMAWSVKWRRENHPHQGHHPADSRNWRKRLPLFFHESLSVDTSPETGRICHRESCGSQAYDRLSKPWSTIARLAISPIPTRSSKKPWTMSAWIIRVRRNSAIFHSGWNNGWELRLRSLTKPDFPLFWMNPSMVSIQSESRNSVRWSSASTMNSVWPSSFPVIILSELYLVANRFGIVDQGRLIKEISKAGIRRTRRRHHPSRLAS